MSDPGDLSKIVHDPLVADTPETIMAQKIYDGVYNALQKLFETRMAAVEKDLDDALDRVSQVTGDNRELAQRVVELESRAVAVSAAKRPKVHAPEVYDGKDKEKAERFVQQIIVAAKFEHFDNDEQKVLWAQSYLTGTAHSWSALITFGEPGTTDIRKVDWEAWIAGFRETFGTRDVAQDAMRKLNALVQGSKSITDYTTEFRELVSRLPFSEQTGEFVNSRYWDGLTLASKQNLVGTDFTTAAEAQAILLRRESRLSDIASQARRMGGGVPSHSGRPSASAQASTVTHQRTPAPAPQPQSSRASPAAVAAPPAPSRDPNAMDVDGARRRGGPTCFLCGGVGHRQYQCTSNVVAQLKAGMVEDIRAGMVEDIVKSLAAANVGKPAAPQAGTPAAPGPGFV